MDNNQEALTLDDIDEYLRISQVISSHPQWREPLREALQLHKANTERVYWLGFEWWQVHESPRVLNLMVTNRILDVVRKSNQLTVYRIRYPDMVEEALRQTKGTNNDSSNQ